MAQGGTVDKIIHLNRPQQFFPWPKHDDVLHVPKADSMSKIATTSISITGCVYQITDAEFVFLISNLA